MAELYISPNLTQTAQYMGVTLEPDTAALEALARHVHAPVPHNIRVFLSTNEETFVFRETDTEPKRYLNWAGSDKSRQPDDILAIVPRYLEEGSIQEGLAQALLHHRTYNQADTRDSRITRVAKKLGWGGVSGGLVVSGAGEFALPQTKFAEIGYGIFTAGALAITWAFNHSPPKRTMPDLTDLDPAIRITKPPKDT